MVEAPQSWEKLTPITAQQVCPFALIIFPPLPSPRSPLSLSPHTTIGKLLGGAAPLSIAVRFVVDGFRPGSTRYREIREQQKEQQITLVKPAV